MRRAHSCSATHPQDRDQELPAPPSRVEAWLTACPESPLPTRSPVSAARHGDRAALRRVTFRDGVRALEGQREGARLQLAVIELVRNDPQRKRSGARKRPPPPTCRGRARPSAGTSAINRPSTSRPTPTRNSCAPMRPHLRAGATLPGARHHAPAALEARGGRRPASRSRPSRSARWARLVPARQRRLATCAALSRGWLTCSSRRALRDEPPRRSAHGRARSRGQLPLPQPAWHRHPTRMRGRSGTALRAPPAPHNPCC